VTSRRGFAMITMLWVIAVASVIAASAALVGRRAVGASRNRAELERAYWIATGCASRAQAAIDALLQDGSTDDAATLAWRLLDRRLRRAITFDRSCDVELEAAGTRLDVNLASNEMISRLLAALGVSDVASREMVEALGDWKDSDDVVRSGGAERDWYLAQRREPPRNGPLADVRELARVRGFERIADFDTVLGTDGTRVSLATAPVSVLMSVPGVTRETAEAIAQLRDDGTPVGDLAALLGNSGNSGAISPSSADSLTARYADAAHVTTATPDAWVLTVRATSGFPPNRALLELRLTRDGTRCRIASARSVR
jgi:type II secretory pathway component PulK